MKKILLSLLLVLSVVLSARAQRSGAVHATLVDAETGEGIPGAVIEVAPVTKPEQKKYYTSGYRGAIGIDGMAYGQYTLKITFLGYEPYETTVRITAPRQDLGNVEMREEATKIENVVKEVRSMRTSQRGDTVSYNAGAFKVAGDADVEGLLKKMPGITVTDGEVSAQGETVQKVFVDGKEFFGDDVTSAIKSLPAQAVDRIEVYNKLSDQAEFSGMDDGEGYKAINIVTHKDMRQGQFGKMYAGYGYDFDTETEARNKYIVGGNVNIFSGSSRVSLIALFNNINQQNFSFEDILGVAGSAGGGRGRGVGQYMVRPQSGVASVNAFGINYSDTWGKKVTFQGSYFFNGTNTKNYSTVDKWYVLPSPIDTLQTVGYSRTLNYNNRFNARIEWKISDNQSLMIRPGLSFQTNDPYSWTKGSQRGESGYTVIDNLSDAFRNGYNIRTSAIYRAKLGKPGRTITVDGFLNYSDRSRKQNSYSNIAEPFTGNQRPSDDELTDLLYQRVVNPTYSYRLDGNITYTEPVSQTAQLSMQYRASYNFQKSDKQAYRTGDDFNIDGLLPDPLLSNDFRSGYFTNRIGPGFRYAKERNTLVANVYYQRSNLSGKVENKNSERIRHSYDNVTYFLMGQLNLNRENSLRLFVFSSTDNPSVTDLQSVYDVSDAQYISRGNPLLRPSYTHRVNFHYVNSNVEKGRTFMWMFSLQNTSNYIARSIEYGKELEIDGAVYRPLQYTEPVNMDGYWSLRTHLSYGFPLNFMRCNLNVMGGVNYTVVPSRVVTNGVSARNDADNIGYDARVVLGSNISENVDFTLSWDGTYNEATNSLASSAGKNRYFNHTASASLKLVFWKGFTFTGNASYTQYVGFTNNYNDEFLLCNLYLGKKVFRSQRGEISVGVNDVFNQNRAFVRTTGSGWTQNALNSVIGRYYCVQFVYNLRHFGKRGSKNVRDYDGVAEPRKNGDGVGMSRSSSGRGFRGGAPHPPLR